MDSTFHSNGYCPSCDLNNSKSRFFLNYNNLFECETCHLQVDLFDENTILIYPLKGAEEHINEQPFATEKLAGKLYARSILSETEKDRFEKQLRVEFTSKLNNSKEEIVYKLFIKRNKTFESLVIQETKNKSLNLIDEDYRQELYSSVLNEHKLYSNFLKEKNKMEFEFDSSVQIFLNLYDPFYRYNNKTSKLFNQIEKDLFIEISTISELLFNNFCRHTLLIQNIEELRQMLLLINKK